MGRRPQEEVLGWGGRRTQRRGEDVWSLIGRERESRRRRNDSVFTAGDGEDTWP